MRALGALAFLALLGADEEPQADWHAVAWDKAHVDLIDIGTIFDEGDMRSVVHGRASRTGKNSVEELVIIQHRCARRVSALVQRSTFAPDGTLIETKEFPEKYLPVNNDPVAKARFEIACSGDYGDTYHIPEGDIFVWARGAMDNPAKADREKAEAAAAAATDASMNMAYDSDNSVIDLEYDAASAAMEAAEAAANAADAAYDDMEPANAM